MISNNPVGNCDKLSINLAMTSFYKPDGSFDSNIALRLIPTSTDGNIVTTLDNQARTTYRGSLNELQDEAEKQCVSKIMVALQELINSRGW